MSPSELPIGIFDSGVGGLTVLKAVRARLPREHLIYLGDTARLPYGTKGPETVARYAVQAAGHLVERGIKLLVVACNTASAAAMPALVREFAPLPGDLRGGSRRRSGRARLQERPYRGAGHGRHGAGRCL